jgi:hypothetical protein
MGERKEKACPLIYYFSAYPMRIITSTLTQNSPSAMYNLY